jgi:DNA polymerase III delta' subunit
MAFKDFPQQSQSIALLQRALQHGRLAHAYLFTGHHLEDLEALAGVLAKAINCQQPLKGAHFHTDSCDRCPSCRKIDHNTHPDIHWVRPESKSRVITVEQMRNLMKEIQLKPGEADFKVAIIVAADRLRVEAANAFLKTLEEPPAKSILILLSTDPQRVLETILSRCLRLNFTGGSKALGQDQRQWLADFSRMASAEQKSLLVRYRLLDVLLEKLNQINTQIEQTLTARSPLQQYKDADKAYIEKWEAELAAAIEAEYRRQRADVLKLLQWWLRDVWLHKVLTGPVENGERRRSQNEGPCTTDSWNSDLRSFADLPGTDLVAQRISNDDAMENLQTLEQLQRWLGTNVQEALALEVGLLKLRL